MQEYRPPGAKESFHAKMADAQDRMILTYPGDDTHLLNFIYKITRIAESPQIPSRDPKGGRPNNIFSSTRI